jgi:hypothetical protein
VTFIVVLSFAAIAVAAGVLYWWSARRDARRGYGPPPVVFPLPPSRPLAHPNGSHGVHGTNGAHAANGNGYHGNGASRPADRPADRPYVRPFAADGTPRVNQASHVHQTNHADGRRPVTPVDTDEDNAETVRFVRPTDLDAAVQLLPGRLEVLEGATPHREIRFMRVPGEPPHVTLGREIRLTPHYVGLGSPTVSRRHARLDFVDNRWMVRNLSRTNPLVVNDDELFDTGPARPLMDGDLLELGEIVLRFHAH